MVIGKPDIKIKLAVLAAACSAAMALAGCGPDKPPEIHPIWPPPPSLARVAHRKNIRVASDLARPGFFRRLFRAIAGDDEMALIRPHGAAVSDDGYLYITDQERQGVVVFGLDSWAERLIDRVGEVFLVSPVGIAVCEENIAVSDSALKRVFILTPDGELVRRIGPDGGFARPTGLTYDRARKHLYVVDTLAHEVLVFSPTSGALVRRFGSPGTRPGKFNYPTHIFVDAKGLTYVTDSLNFRVQVFDGKGKYLRHIGRLGDASGHLAVPKGVAVDPQGHIYIVDSYFSTVQVFSQSGAFLMALGGPGKESGQLEVPAGLAVDGHNKLYVCDSYNGRVQLLEYIGDEDD